jgi:hypothetical protein
MAGLCTDVLGVVLYSACLGGNGSAGSTCCAMTSRTAHAPPQLTGAMLAAQYWASRS